MARESMDLQFPFGEHRVPSPPTSDVDPEVLWGDNYYDFWSVGRQNEDIGYGLDGSLSPLARPMKKQKIHGLNNTAQSPIVIDDSPALGPTKTSLLSEQKVPPASLDIGASTLVSTGDDALLSEILEIFPDICHEYVKGLLAQHKIMILDDENDVKVAALTSKKAKIISDILEAPSYPKQKDSEKKTGSVDEDDEKRKIGRQNWGAPYNEHANDVLAQEFPSAPLGYIRALLTREKSLYTAYLTLSALESSSDTPKYPYPFGRLKRPRRRTQHWANEILDPEVKAAKEKIEKDAAASRKQREEEEAERLNEEEFTRTGTTLECQCCYGDVPLNRTISCDGNDVHFFCFNCIRRSAETQIGLMKYKLQCFDTSGCQANFARCQLAEVLGSVVMKKLDTLQQQDEVEQAGLEGLESCPFCEFKAICPPVEEDRLFLCHNPSCERVSCRLCKEENHVPKTCAEAKHEKGMPERLQVEEAMSEAFIRSCPKCNVKIIKEHGCNKMICSKCNCAMCYICKQDISGTAYQHFDRAPTFCNLHDTNAANRFQDEIDQAQKTTIDRILSEKPNLTEEELTVHHSNKKKPKTSASTPRNLPTAFNPIALPIVPVQRTFQGYIHQPYTQAFMANAPPEMQLYPEARRGSASNMAPYTYINPRAPYGAAPDLMTNRQHGFTFGDPLTPAALPPDYPRSRAMGAATGNNQAHMHPSSTQNSQGLEPVPGPPQQGTHPSLTNPRTTQAYTAADDYFLRLQLDPRFAQQGNRVMTSRTGPNPNLAGWL